jgi:hypothetical protein
MEPAKAKRAASFGGIGATHEWKVGRCVDSLVRPLCSEFLAAMQNGQPWGWPFLFGLAILFGLGGLVA